MNISLASLFLAHCLTLCQSVMKNPGSSGNGDTLPSGRRPDVLFVREPPIKYHCREWNVSAGRRCKSIQLLHLSSSTQDHITSMYMVVKHNFATNHFIPTYSKAIPHNLEFSLGGLCTIDPYLALTFLMCFMNLLIGIRLQFACIDTHTQPTIGQACSTAQRRYI